MTFDQAAVETLVANVASKALALGIFRSVNTHEPKAAPGSGLRLAIWADSIQPLGSASGLNATSGYVVLNCRAYGNMLVKPEDDIDPRLMTAASSLINAFSGDFNLGGSVRAIDLLGQYGTRLESRAGYIQIAQTTYRIMTVTLPVIVNDLWTQVA